LAAAAKALELDPMNFAGRIREDARTENAGTASDPWGTTWSGYMRGAVQNYLELAAAYAGARTIRRRR
jgi:hypothetical protein